MKKRFKRRKRIHLNFIFYIILIMVIGYIIDYAINNINIMKDNQKLINTILLDTNPYLEANDTYFSSSILNTMFYMEEPFRVSKTNNLSSQKDFTYNIKDQPRVYIYSTHDEEEYLSDYKEGYDLSPNIVAASHLLKDELNKRGILTIVESNKVSDYRKANNLNFYDSYKISRNYILNTLTDYPNLELIIDLHRDSLSRNITYIEHLGQSYAKVLFVVGQKYATYKDNLALSNKIDEAINKQVAKVSKGIMMKNGAEQNGVYNQDIKGNIILLELGSNNNTVDEIYNSIILVANAIEEVLNENKT